MISQKSLETKDNYAEKLARAQKRVNDIKKFYRHLRVYFIINILLLLIKFQALDFINMKGVQDPAFFNWFQWNILATPTLWGIGLLFHALWVFKFDAKPLKELRPKFLKNWETSKFKNIWINNHLNNGAQ